MFCLPRGRLPARAGCDNRHARAGDNESPYNHTEHKYPFENGPNGDLGGHGNGT